MGNVLAQKIHTKNMKQEISVAVDFIITLSNSRFGNKEAAFSTTLKNLLFERFQTITWDLSSPWRGSGNRRIRLDSAMDPLLAQAAGYCNITTNELHMILPSHLILWIDPLSVSFKLGERSPEQTIYSVEQPQQQRHQSNLNTLPYSVLVA